MYIRAHVSFNMTVELFPSSTPPFVLREPLYYSGQVKDKDTRVM